MKILNIPDSHAEPGVDNNRFEALGNFILETKPDVIVNIGDMADMSSLSSYDRGKSDFHSRRYQDDIEAVNDALKRLHKPLDDYNKVRSSWRKKQYKPKFVFCMGNHENRINTAISTDKVMLEGLISTDDIKLKERGYTVVPFMTPITIGGVMFQHYFPSGVMGMPIGGVNAARSHALKLMVSTVSGHSHLFDHAVNTRHDGKKIHNLVGGCFFEHSHEFAKNSEYLYWRGFNVLNNVSDGEFELEQHSLKKLMENYY